MTFPTRCEPTPEYVPVSLDVLFPLSAKDRPLIPAPDLRQRSGRRCAEQDDGIDQILTEAWQSVRSVSRALSVSRFTAKDRLELAVAGGRAERRTDGQQGMLLYRRKSWT